MKKLADLKKFLSGIEHIELNKLDVYAEDIQLKLKGKHLGNGLALLEMNYVATADIEDWPHGKHSVVELFAQVVGWVADYDGDRDNLDNQDISAIPNIHDDRTADLELSIHFSEDIEVIEAPDGAIKAFGKTWTLANIDIDVAETFCLETANKEHNS